MEQPHRTTGQTDQFPTDLPVEELTRRANAFLEKNDFVQAYPYVSRLAEHEEADPQAGVTAGLLALTLNKNVEAARHFRHARDRAPDNFDANYNLALLDIAAGNFDEAASILQILILRQPENAPLHNDLAVVWMNKKDARKALHSFEEALRFDPNFAKARENAIQFIMKNDLFAEGRHLLRINTKHPQVSEASLADIKRWHGIIDRSSPNTHLPGFSETKASPTPMSIDGRLKGKKIAFFASQLTFVKDIIQNLSQENEARTFGGRSVPEMIDLMEWADVAWFEWCDPLIIEATKHPKRCWIVCRLHSYEAFTDMPSKVDWSKVDRLIFVNRSVEEIFRRQVPTEVPITIIHNGVDVDRFNIPGDKEYGKKIASVGYINYKKNPALLLYCFKKIHAYDPEYSLHIAGQHQDPRIQVYFEHFLGENPLPVHFDGWVDDMPAWYADKDYVISTSLFESFHYSIAEGMSSGLMPLIHDWYGAKEIYPREYLFTDPDECLGLLKRMEKAERHQLAQENRRFIVERYNQAGKYEQIVKLLASVTENSPAASLTPKEEFV